MTSRFDGGRVLHDVLVGLTVSFVAISLGGAFGILSGRGAFAGILSAGLIALVTSLLGGTRIQCSGPTAPMTAVTAAVVAMAGADLAARLPGVDPDRFINFSLLLAALLLVMAAALRLGAFIRLIPAVVISGFMNGIAILIWVDQVQKLFGIAGRAPFGGPVAANAAIAAVTVVLAFTLPRALTRAGVVLRRIPATLVTLVIMTLLVQLSPLAVERVHLRAELSSLAGFAQLVQRQIPADWTWAWVWVALPAAAQLAMLCYLDTLLTSLIVDRMTGERTRQNQELFAQGAATAVVAVVGGIPGAQATIRSVLMLKERATTRLAGVMVGAFVLVEMVLFRDVIGAIPQSVFTGILIKVGYDVFDWHPVRLYAHAWAAPRAPTLGRMLAGTAGAGRVSHAEMGFILGTTAATVLVDLNVAVIGFTVLYHLVRRRLQLPEPTQVPGTAAVADED
jgi:SulP family sulfate permease